MARIRSIKPEFWTDDLVGAMHRDARLLFIATWNLADDEGLLRWSAPYLKGAVFPFDDDISVQDVEQLMAALTESGVVWPYNGGRSQQRLGYIINFHKHQKINRPTPSKLPPPSIQDHKTRAMYASRDGNKCHLCGGDLDMDPVSANDDFRPSIDHLVPVEKGGTDYPSNLRAAHMTCNKGRGSRSIDEYRATLAEGKSAAQQRHPERFTHPIPTGDDGCSVNDSVRDSPPDREHGAWKGREGNGSDGDERARAKRAVLEAMGVWNDPRWLGDGGLVEAWMNAGADLDRDILPTIKSVMAKRGAQGPPSSLKYFDRAVMDAHATRTTPPKPGKPNAAAPSRDQTELRRAGLAAAFAGLAGADPVPHGPD